MARKFLLTGLMILVMGCIPALRQSPTPTRISISTPTPRGAVTWMTTPSPNKMPTATPMPAKRPTVLQSGGRVWSLGDLHLHTICSDGWNADEEMVQKALDRKYAFIASIDHRFGGPRPYLRPSGTDVRRHAVPTGHRTMSPRNTAALYSRHGSVGPSSSIGLGHPEAQR